MGKIHHSGNITIKVIKGTTGPYLGKIQHTRNTGIIDTKEIGGAANCDQEYPREQQAPPNYLITYKSP